MADKKEKKDSETLGIAGFTLGIVSLVMLLFVPIVGVISSIVGFIMCYNQQKRKPTKFGKRGIVINAIGFTLNVVWWIVAANYIYPLLNEQFPTS